jgi:hypothetical protein
MADEAETFSEAPDAKTSSAVTADGLVNGKGSKDSRCSPIET